MIRSRSRIGRVCRLAPWATVLVVTALGSADVIYETEDPFGGVFGLWGADVCLDQSVAMRFTPDGDYRLDRVALWLMSNDFAGTIHPLVEVTLRTDDNNVPGVSIPSENIIESWRFNVAAVGWNPVLEEMVSALHPLLFEGVNYWIVTESRAVCGDDGVWNFASFGLGFVAYSLGFGQDWQPGGSSAALASVVEGTAIAASDFDFDGDVDLDDHAVLAGCLSGPNEPTPPAGCTPQQFAAADVDEDIDVDLHDFRQFQSEFGRP
ncbi:MAG: hypothetical protein GY778_08565 [bacterium]|nr:hypothetical protein [bacterium]